MNNVTDVTDCAAVPREDRLQRCNACKRPTHIDELTYGSPTNLNLTTKRTNKPIFVGPDFYCSACADILQVMELTVNAN